MLPASLLLSTLIAAQVGPAPIPTTFRFVSPGATEVCLVGEMNAWKPGATPMVRGEDGAFTVTVPLAPGQWLYKIWADGKWLADPANPLWSPDGRGGRHSWVIVGDGDFRRREGTPHGRVQTLAVPSRALGKDVEVRLHEPPGAGDAPLPVLVLVHGHGVDSQQWVDNGLIADLMDNLLQQGRIRPFLVAMPSVMDHVDHPGLARMIAELPDRVTEQRSGHRADVPRALGGFSMGGGITLMVASELPGTFQAWFPLAAGLRDQDVPRVGGLAWRAGPLGLICGAEDALLHRSQGFVTALQAVGAEAQLTVVPGGHTFRFLNAVTPGVLERASAAFEKARRPWYARTVRIDALLPERPVDGAPIGTVRRDASPLAAPAGLATPRTCGGAWCVDGLTDPATGATFMAAKMSADELETLGGPGGWLERAVRVVAASDKTVSAYVGSVWFSAGAAHRNASLSCATWRRGTGARLTLTDLLGAAQARALLRMISELLLDPNRSIDLLGDTLVPDCTGCEATDAGVLIEPGSDGDEPLLCLEVPVPGAGMGEVHELRLGPLRRALEKGARKAR